MDITINLSKPEKDPRDIAKADAAKKSGYPACLLCRENEGYAGHLSHPARQNHRIIPITLCGEQYYLQYSPYVYYNEHCIVLNTQHVPMTINREVFEKLFDFVDGKKYVKYKQIHEAHLNDWYNTNMSISDYMTDEEREKFNKEKAKKVYDDYFTPEAFDRIYKSVKEDGEGGGSAGQGEKASACLCEAATAGNHTGIGRVDGLIEGQGGARAEGGIAAEAPGRGDKPAGVDRPIER